MTKLPNLRDKTFIAHIKVTENAGKVKPHDQSSNDKHVSVWLYKTFNPTAAVVKVEAL